MLGTYGAGLLCGHKLTYEEWFSLWLLRDRVKKQRADAVKIGIDAALGKASDAYYAAQFDSQEEADEAAFWAMAQASMERVVGQYVKR